MHEENIETTPLVASVVASMAASALCVWIVAQWQPMVFAMQAGQICLWLAGWACFGLAYQRAGLRIGSLFGSMPTLGGLRLASTGLFASLLVNVGALSLILIALSEADVRAAQTELSPTAKGLSLLGGLVLAPIGEELLFRGILFQRWSQKWGAPKAAIIVSVIFGFLHADPVGAFVFSLVMVLIYTATNSLWLTIGAHALNNGFPEVAEPLLVKYFGDVKPETGQLLTVGAICLAIGLPLTIAFVRKHWPSLNSSLSRSRKLRAPSL